MEKIGLKGKLMVNVLTEWYFHALSVSHARTANSNHPLWARNARRRNFPERYARPRSNGNGDLTEKDKRFVLALDEYDRKRGKRVWKVGDIEAPGGKVRYTGLQVSEISKAASEVTGLGAGYGVAVKVPIAGHRVLQGAGGFVYPHHGFRLQFAARPQDAPIIHFGGPLRLDSMASLAA
jgi:hypothetical protein